MRPRNYISYKEIRSLKKKRRLVPISRESNACQHLYMFVCGQSRALCSGKLEHRGPIIPQPYSAENADATGALATPVCSKWRATRIATSSRQGAAIICTARGNPASNQTGAATTGKPMNEMGWV